VVEHYLDTVGVTGSNPVSRTISSPQCDDLCISSKSNASIVTLFCLDGPLTLTASAWRGFRALASVGWVTLQDADIERTLIKSVAAGLGVALLPDQVKKLPRDSVVFRQLSPAVKTESCIAWKTDNPSVALKAYVTIVGDRSVRMR
jgi:hypothetical protein